MPISPDSIADDSSTLPANSEAAPADKEGEPQISPEVLALPIMRGLLEGSPAAVWTPTGSKSPDITVVLKHGPELVKAGFSFFRDKKSGLDLFYNRRFLQPQLVEKAAEKGRLKDISSPLSEVSAAINGAVGETAGAETTLPAAGTPSPVPLNSPIDTQRKNNLSPQGPTSGGYPGGGRILNNITQPVI